MTVDHLTRRPTTPIHVPLDAPTAPAAPAAPASPRLRRIRYEPDPVAPDHDDLRSPAPPVMPVTADLPADPAARAAAHRLIQLVLEVLSRRRPVAHLAGVADPPVLRWVRAAVLPSGALWLSSLRVCQPHDTAAEITAVCRAGTCHRVIAARVERRDAGGWRCTTLRLI